MFKNLSMILFLLMLCLGSIISISANSWMGVWMGLEINLLSFIPLMTNKNNLNNTEAALNYFLIQAFASTIILFSMIMNIIMMNSSFFLNYLNMANMPLLTMKLILMTLMLKLGAAPFHFWFPNVAENISWLNNLILLIWQKLAPMMIIPYLTNINKLLMIFILLSALIGAIGGFNQISLRKLIAFSSINHMSWMFTAILFNENLWLIYFIIYFFLNLCVIYLFKIFKIFYLSQMYTLFMNSALLKFNLLTPILSLGGLPPFLGFLPKWMIIQSLIFMKMNMISMFLICMSLITLFYYLKIGFSAFILNYNELNWSFKNFHSKYLHINMLNMNFISLFSFFLIIDLIYLI